MRASRGGGLRAVRRTLQVLGGAGILVLLGRRLGGAPFLDALGAVTGATVAMALGLGVLTTALSAWRWTLVARGLGMHLPLRGAVGDYYQALFLNGVLPAGVLGDVHRAVQHGRVVGDLPRAAKAVVLERTAGQLMLVAAGLVALVVNPGMVPRSLRSSPVTGWLAAALIVTVIAAAIAVRRRGWVGDARRGLLDPGTRVGIFAASAVVLVGHLLTFMVAARATGATAPVTRLVPLMLVALLAMSLPLNIGGWGAREGATAWGFAATGLDASQGLTVAVVYGLCALVASLPGAVVLIGRWAASARAGRPMTAQVGRPTPVGSAESL